MNTGRFNSFVGSIARVTKSKFWYSGQGAIPRRFPARAILTGISFIPYCSLSAGEKRSTALELLPAFGCVGSFTKGNLGPIFANSRLGTHQHSENTVTNRAVSAGNAPVTGGQSRRLDSNNRAAALNGVIWTRRCRPYCPKVVNRAGVTARGFVWLTVSREIHQKRRAIPILEICEAEPSLVGLVLQPAQNPFGKSLKLLMNSNSFNLVPVPSDSLQSILHEYTRLTFRAAPLPLYEHSLFDFVRAGFTVTDMSTVLTFILRENGKNHFKYSLKLGPLLNDLQRFNDLLQEAKVKMRNHIPKPTPKQQVVQQFSPVVGETLTGDTAMTAKQCLERLKQSL